MIEASVDCVITIDAQSTILEFNAAAERTFGYQRDHVIGKLLTETIIPPDLREAHRRGIAALLRGENGNLLGQRVEMPAMRSDGSEFPVELTITRIGSQSPPLFTAYLRDITEQKRAAEELSQSLALLRAITEGTTDAVFAKDRQGRYLLFNTAAARFVDKSIDEVIGLDDASSFSPETAARIMERDRFVMESGETRTDEDLTTSLAGTYRVYLTTKGPLRDASGAIAGMFGIARDITARKEEEEKLRKSETRFRELAENIDEVFWVWTANLGSARLLYVNPAYAAIWGRSCESLYSSPQSWQEALHPEDKETVLAAIAECDLEKMSELTYRIVRPDQSIRWISDRIFPVRDESGVVARFAGIARDITERKMTEIALERAEEQYHSIFNNAVDGIFRTSPEGKFLVANPAAARILRFASPEELIEERNDIARQGYVDPARREEFKRLIQEQGIVTGFEYEAYRKDGSHVWISENTRAVHGPNGEVLFFEGVFEDVTDRKRAEKAVEEQALRYKTLMETSTDSIYVLAENGDLLEANAAFLRRRGYTAAEAKGLNVADWDAQWSREELQGRIRNLAGKSAVFETRHRCKDGSIFDVEVCATGVRIGEEQLIIGVTRDISERKQAEHKMRAQLDELRRWQELTLGREDRVLELKREVNQLSQRLGERARYPSQT